MNIPVAIGATALSILFPNSSGSRGDRSSSSSSAAAAHARSFLVGACAGAGLCALVVESVRRRRLRERARASYVAWLKRRDDADAAATTTPRLFAPRPASELARRPLFARANENDDAPHRLDEATSRVLASPRTTLSSDLYACLVDLPFGSRTRPREAKGVELYYVLEGGGTLVRDGDDVATGGGIRVTVGDVFVVNPWSVRWLENRERSNFCFLRVSDSGRDYCDEENYDAVVELDVPSSYGKRAVDVVKSGLRRTYDAVRARTLLSTTTTTTTTT